MVHAVRGSLPEETKHLQRTDLFFTTIKRTEGIGAVIRSSVCRKKKFVAQVSRVNSEILFIGPKCLLQQLCFLKNSIFQRLTTMLISASVSGPCSKAPKSSAG